MSFCDDLNSITVSYSNSVVEVQARFDYPDTANIFFEHLNKTYGIDKHSCTDFRGMPVLKFDYNSRHKIIICGADIVMMSNILEDYRKFIIGKRLDEEKPKSNIPIITW